jgi:hypothetical protein
MSKLRVLDLALHVLDPGDPGARSPRPPPCRASASCRRPNRARRCASGRPRATGRSATRTRVALPTGTPAQLVVDAARLVPLGADDVQAALLADPALIPERPLMSVAVDRQPCWLPPSTMSVPRPAMLVAIVTSLRPPPRRRSAPRARDAWRSAPRAGCRPRSSSSAPASSRDFSIDVVPTRIGRPRSCTSTISSTTARYFSLDRTGRSGRRGRRADQGGWSGSRRPRAVDLVELGASVIAVPVIPASLS